MTDEISAMAREAGIGEPVNHEQWDADLPRLKTFAELIKQKERERIANQIDRMPFGDTAASFAVWIRAGAP